MQIDIKVTSRDLELMRKDWPHLVTVPPRKGDLIKSRGGWLAKINNVTHCGVGTRPTLEIEIVEIDT